MPTDAGKPKLKPDVRAIVEGLLRLAPAEQVIGILGEVKQEETRQENRSPFQEKYWLDPVGWAHDNVVWRPGEGLTDYQEEILGQIPREKRVCFRGPRGTGKTTLMSLTLLWFATTRDGFDWKIITTASVNRQLKEFLWPEIHKWSRRLRWNKIGRKPFSDKTELLTQELRLRTGSAFSISPTDPAAGEGAHAEHILYILDESKAIQDAKFDAMEGALSSGEGTEAFVLCGSTPGDESGRFYDIQTNHEGRYSDWWVRAVSQEEVIRAGRMSREFAEKRAIQWGAASFLYVTQILGNFAKQGKDGVIPFAWAESAQERWRENEGLPLAGEVVLGVDVADEEGSDKSVVVVRVGHRIVEIHDWMHQDTMGTVDRVLEIASIWNPVRIVVDGIGLGAGVVSRLRQLEMPVFNFVASSSAGDLKAFGNSKFYNLRAAAWWSLRERLHPQLGKGLELHLHDHVLADLTAPTWKMAGDRVLIESKEDIRTRLQKQRDDGGSTDVGDAIVMAYWDGADSNYEDSYNVHTAETLRAAAKEAQGEMPIEQQRAVDQAKWEREQMFGSPEKEPAGGTIVRWFEEMMNERWWR